MRPLSRRLHAFANGAAPWELTQQLLVTITFSLSLLISSLLVVQLISS